MTGETLRRPERYEGPLNAFVLYDPEEAIAQARASEARWQKDKPKGFRDGVPVAMKDTVLTRGWPRLLGSRTINPNQQWNEASPVSARLQAEGTVFGKTTTPEFGSKPVTDSSLSRITRNPWSPERTPGGSAVVAGICPLAVGTDVGGSIRIPGRVLRYRRAQADIWPRRGISTIGLRRCCTCRPDGAHARRRRADARCDQGAGFARLAQPA